MRENHTTKEISLELGISTTTVLDYTHKAIKLGLIDENYIKARKPNGELYVSTNNSVVTYYDGVEVGVFKSIAELSEKSKEMFGVLINPSTASECVNLKRDGYKGYTIKRVV